MTRIVLADDHPLVREGIRAMLHRFDDLTVVGEAARGTEAVAVVATLRPDLLLLDLRMPDGDGPEVTRRVIELGTGTKVLILTTYDTDDDILPAIEAGANGYLLKDVEPARLAEAIRQTVHGATVLDPRAASAIATSLREPVAAELSDREQRVVQLVAQGYTNSRIAHELSVSESTVKTYLARAFQKLGVNDRAAAVVEAIRRGAVRP